MRILGFLVLALGVLAILVSLPLLGFAVLGFLGILADVSPAENRGFAMQLLWMGLTPLIAGVIMSVVGLLPLARNHRHTDTRPGVAPDR